VTDAEDDATAEPVGVPVALELGDFDLSPFRGFDPCLGISEVGMTGLEDDGVGVFSTLAPVDPREVGMIPVALVALTEPAGTGRTVGGNVVDVPPDAPRVSLTGI
jgi:hypothetical protein